MGKLLPFVLLPSITISIAIAFALPILLDCLDDDESMRKFYEFNIQMLNDDGTMLKGLLE